MTFSSGDTSGLFFSLLPPNKLLNDRTKRRHAGSISGLKPETTTVGAAAAADLLVELQTLLHRENTSSRLGIRKPARLKRSRTM